MAKQALSIKAILNECQKGFAEQKKYANALWNACISQGEPAVAELMECLLRWVTTEEVSQGGLFCACATPCHPACAACYAQQNVYLEVKNL